MIELDAMGGQKMRANNIKIKLPRQRHELYNPQLNIKDYGEDNLYPQHVKALVTLTPTAASCYERYCDFIIGKGIEGGDDIMVNPRQTLNDVVADMARSLGMHQGLAIHPRYNAVGQIVSFKCMPFETIRLGEDDDFGYIRDYVYCADWSGRAKTKNGSLVVPQTDNTRYLPFNDDPSVVVGRMASYGGVQNYPGDILYISNTTTYPISPIDAVITDMSTESGLQNISYRNSRSSFKPSALICYKAGSADSNKKFERIIAEMVGDETSSGVSTIKLRDFEDMPRTLDLKTENFDKSFETTAAKGEERIYSAFKQETFYLLRIGKVGFGGDVEADAFNLMNLSVAKERATIEKVLKRIAKRWCPTNTPFPTDLKIGDLLYNKENSNTNNNASTVQ